MEMSSIAVVTGTLTLSTLQTKTDAFANSVDPDETACNEPSHQDLHCLPFCFLVFYLHPHLQQWTCPVQSWKRPLQKLRGERVKG